MSVFSSRGVPEIAGSADGSGALGPVTTAVWSDVASAEPPAFVPVTRTRSVEPMSSVVTSYVASVAPGISAQAAPEASQRSH